MGYVFTKQLPPPFATRLHYWYHVASSKKKYPPYRKKRNQKPWNHYALNASIMNLLNNSFNINHYYYSSPSTSNNTTPYIEETYYLDPWDTINPQNGVLWQRVKEVAWPTPTTLTPKKPYTCPWWRSKEDPIPSTIYVINHKDWSTQTLPLDYHEDIHTMHLRHDGQNTIDNQKPSSHPSHTSKIDKSFPDTHK